MAATLKVPTIFTAVDKVSQIVKRMGKTTMGVMSKLERGVGGANRLFNRLTPSIGEAGRQLLSLASAGAITAAFFSGASFSFNSLMDYEDAVASFRTIVSDLNNTEFAKFENSIADVANKTKKSTIDVAKSFENIAGLNADFAKTADGLSAVSEASIILAKASKMELGAAAENLVGIMNQFGYEAKDANKAINILAAGQAVGASNISQSAEAYKNFGTVAKTANMTLEESQAIIQTLGKFTILGAEAGTKARGVTLQLQKAGLGYKSGIYNQVDALKALNGKLATLKTAKQKDALITKVFGDDNITAGKILLNNMDLTEQYRKGVTDTSEAQLGASINSNTLRTKIDELKNSWINIITTHDDTNESLSRLKIAIGWVTDNLQEIIKWVAISTAGILAFKAALLITQATMFVYNVALGIFAALHGGAAISLTGNTVALNAWNITLKIGQAAMWLWAGVMKVVTAAQWLWNAAMTANPIGIIIVAIGALIALVVAIIYYWDEWGSTIVKFMGPLGIIIDFIMTLRQNWEMVKKAFKDGGILGALKAIGRVLLDVLLKPVQMLLGALSKIPGLSSLAGNGLEAVTKMRDSLGVKSSDKAEREAKDPALMSPTIRQGQRTSESVSTTRNYLDIFLDDPSGKAQTKQRGPLDIPIRTTPTTGKK
jgi:TP901 family phage tail tape measure protein